MQQSPRGRVSSWFWRRDTAGFVGYILIAGLYVVEDNSNHGQPLGVSGMVIAGLALTLISLWGLAVASGQLLPQREAMDTDRVGNLLDLGWFAFNLLVGIPIAFGLLSQNCASIFGGFAGVPHGSPDSAWAGFAYSWVEDSITFNASQVFGWMTTPNQATAPWARGLIVVFSFIADVIVVAGLVAIAKRVAALIGA